MLEDISTYLDETFPGSTLGDGYSFVRFQSHAQRRVRVGLVQAVLDALGGARWLVVVGVDPRPFAPGSTFEPMEFVYEPDYNVRKPIKGWLVEVHPDGANMAQIAASLPDVSALAAISTERDVAYHVNLARLYSPSSETLDRLATTHPQLFVGENESVPLVGEEARRLHDRLVREQRAYRARRLEEEKDRARASGKEPFDLDNFRALGVDVTVEGRVNDPVEQQARFEEMYYVQFPELRTLAELAAKEIELADWR